MSNLWIILCVLCWHPQTESQTVQIVKHKTDWFTANQTCIMHHGRLPGVNIYDHRLKLKDLSETKNISYPFWIAATYEIMDYSHCEPHNDMCSDTLCQTIAISSEKIHVEWRPCSEYNNFSCAFSHGEIYQESDLKLECKDWPGAFQECKARNLSLATRENVQFLKMVETSAKTFWLDDMPQSNLAPDKKMENTACYYSSNGIIHDGNCSDTSMTTVCILVNTTGITPTISTMVPHQTIYTTGIAHTTSTMFPSPTEYTTGMWPILGSALGGFVVIVIVVLIIIIVLRRRRMKKNPEKDFNYNANNKPVTENMSQMKPAYDTVLGESFALGATIATSTRVSTAQEEEPVIYARPQKGKTNSRSPIDVPFCIKQLTDEKENTGIYSVVQKGEKTHSIPSTFVNDDVLGKDYYDISFKEPGKEEAVENVYNKANFNQSGRDQTVNMYDKANFSHEILDNSTGNNYDEANFYYKILENNTGNDYNEANFRHKILENNTGNDYDEANFRHESLENNTGNDYDEANFCKVLIVRDS